MVRPTGTNTVYVVITYIYIFIQTLLLSTFASSRCRMGSNLQQLLHITVHVQILWCALEKKIRNEKRKKKIIIIKNIFLFFPLVFCHRKQYRKLYICTCETYLFLLEDTTFVCIYVYLY